MTMSPLERVSISLVAALALALPASAADWPQFRGVDRDGKSSETGLLGEWPKAGPPLAWKVTGIGAGFSSVSVVGDRIYTMGDLDDGQYVFAIARDGSKIQWKTNVGPVHDDKYGGPRATPTIDGDRLYVMTTEGAVVCLGVDSGAEIWRRSLPREFDGYLMKAMGSYDWKWSESPLVDGDRVIVTPGHVAALLVALNKKTGEEIWRTKSRRLGPLGADGAGYSSVVVTQALGIRQYVQVVGRGLVGVDAESGRILWNYNRIANDIANIATPIVEGDYVLASTGYGTGSGLIKIVQAEEGLDAEEVYFLDSSTMQNHHGGLILLGDTVFTGTGHNKGFPLAVEFKTGKVLWGPERNEGKESAAILYADRRLYFRYQDGRMILVEATSDGYRERGSFMIPDVETFSWAHPVVSDGQLLLRERDALYAYDVGAGAEEAETSSE
jgi:outer membrane protein assembly factor BamB